MDIIGKWKVAKVGVFDIDGGCSLSKVGGYGGEVIKAVLRVGYIVFFDKLTERLCVGIGIISR